MEKVCSLFECRLPWNPCVSNESQLGRGHIMQYLLRRGENSLPLSANIGPTLSLNILLPQIFINFTK